MHISVNLGSFYESRGLARETADSLRAHAQAVISAIEASQQINLAYNPPREERRTMAL